MKKEMIMLSLAKDKYLIAAKNMFKNFFPSLQKVEKDYYLVGLLQRVSKSCIVINVMGII